MITFCIPGKSSASFPPCDLRVTPRRSTGRSDATTGTPPIVAETGEHQRRAGGNRLILTSDARSRGAAHVNPNAPTLLNQAIRSSIRYSNRVYEVLGYSHILYAPVRTIFPDCALDGAPWRCGFAPDHINLCR